VNPGGIYLENPLGFFVGVGGILCFGLEVFLKEIGTKTMSFLLGSVFVIFRVYWKKMIVNGT